MTPSVGENVEQPSRTAGGEFKQHGQYGETCSITSQSWTHDYLLIQRVHSWESAELYEITNCQPFGTYENGHFMESDLIHTQENGCTHPAKDLHKDNQGGFIRNSQQTKTQVSNLV